MSTTSTPPRYARSRAPQDVDPPLVDDGEADSPTGFDGLDEDTGPEPVDPAELARQHVTAVLVAHEGRRWLPRVLQSLERLERAPDLVVAVDTGSKDDTVELLGRSLGEPAVTTARRTSGFGAAVDEALVAADARTGAGIRTGQVEWIWLLHDDSAPEPRALLRLLECAVRHPDAAVVGPKVRGWGDRRQLLEVGLTITTGGRRYTGLERRELDQGQHDETRDVLAVGSAGMLVRRSVWEELGGFDPVLALFRDDVDFGWRANLAGHRVVVCPDAVVHHAEAAAHGRRRIGTTRQRPHLVDRRNALHVVLANCSLRRLPLALLQVTVGCLLRSVGFLFGKLPLTALEELVALGAVLVRPDRLVRARRARAGLRHRTPQELRRLFPPRGHQLRYASDTLLSVVSGTGAGQDLTVANRRSTGTDDDPEAETPATSSLRTAFARPSVVLGGSLLLVALLAERSLLLGGRLMGGALLPAQDQLAALWQTYTSSWHGVGLGSATAAPPYLAVVGLLSVVTVGSVSAIVSILMLASVPLAGLAAYLALRHVVSGQWVRVWGAAVYGLLPATTGAIAAGRLGTCVAIVATPLLGLAVLRTLGTPREPGPLRIAWSAGLLLAVTTAFVPLAWLVALLLAATAVVLGYRTREALLRLGILLLVPPVLLVPWTFEVVRTPVLLFGEAGAPGPGLSDPRLPAWAVAIGSPGGPGSAPVWLFAALAVAGLAGVLRRSRRRAALAGMVVALGGLVLGLVVARVPVTGPTLDAPVAGWPGYATALVVLGFVVAAATGAEGAHQRLAGASFSWRQPAAVVLTVAAIATPLVASAWWVWRGAADPLDRRDPEVLPAYVVAQNELPARTRTLVLARDGEGLVTYALLRDAGPRLGDAETGPGQDTSGPTDRAVGDLVSGRGTDDVAALRALAVAYVYLPAPTDPALVGTLDTVSGLVRASAPDGAAMWRVDTEVSRLWIVNADGTQEALPSGRVGATDRILPGAEGRRLVLAERADDGWRAQLEGRDLEPVTVDGWAQGFELPAAGGQLVLEHRGEQRTRWLWLQAALALVVLVLALPSARRGGDGLEDVGDELDARSEASESLSMVRRTLGPEPGSTDSAPESAPEPVPVRAGVGAGAGAGAGAGVGAGAGADVGASVGDHADLGVPATARARARGRTADAPPDEPPDAARVTPPDTPPAAESSRRRRRGRRAAEDGLRLGGRGLPGRRRRGGERQLSAEEWLGVAEDGDPGSTGAAATEADAAEAGATTASATEADARAADAPDDRSARPAPASLPRRERSQERAAAPEPWAPEPWASEPPPVPEPWASEPPPVPEPWAPEPPPVPEPWTPAPPSAEPPSLEPPASTSGYAPRRAARRRATGGTGGPPAARDDEAAEQSGGWVPRPYVAPDEPEDQR